MPKELLLPKFFILQFPLCFAFPVDLKTKIGNLLCHLVSEEVPTNNEPVGPTVAPPSDNEGLAFVSLKPNIRNVFESPFVLFGLFCCALASLLFR